MAWHLFQWLFFWRRKRVQPPQESEATEVIMVDHSNSARAIEPPEIPVVSPPKPVLVPPIYKVDAPQNKRVAYFTHGCYAVARPGRPRLTAPDSRPRSTNTSPVRAAKPKARPASAQG
jgi:hypothetical protein